MNIPYSNKKHFNQYHPPHTQQQQHHHHQHQDENMLGVAYRTTSVHPMNFNNSHNKFKFEQHHQQQQPYGTPVSDSGSNFGSSYSSSASSFSSLALSNLGSSYTSASSTSTLGSPPNFYYGSSPNPPQQATHSSLNNSYSKTNSFTPLTNSNDSNVNNRTYSTPKSGASQMRPIVHSRPMSWDDVGEYARQSYSTSCSSNNSGGLFMNELSSSMDDLAITSSPGLFGGSQFGSSLTSSYANSFNESKMDNSLVSSTPIDSMFVRSVVDKVLSDMDESSQDDEQSNINTFKPRPTSQYHQRATSIDRYLHPQQQTFKNSTVNRRTLSQSCPTGMAQMNGVGYQLFQQQQQQPISPTNNSGNVLQEDSTQNCRFYYSYEGNYGNSSTLVMSQNNSHTRTQPPNSQPVPHNNSKSLHQTDTYNAMCGIPRSSPSISQNIPSTSGVSPMVVGDVYPFTQPNNNNTGSIVPNNSSNNTNQTTQQVCQFFKKGECKFGDKCRNVHLKNKSKIDEQSRKKLKSIRCRFGVNCPFGHECYYYHTESDFDDTPSIIGINEEK